jgi:hypothetical protein
MRRCARKSYPPRRQSEKKSEHRLSKSVEFFLGPKKEGMYCPNCGQEIVSDGLRFCPRCGLSLTGIDQFLDSDRTPNPQTGLRIFKRKELRVGAQLIFFSIFAVPPAIIFSIVFDSPGPLAIPLLMFLAGITWLSYTFLFGKGLSRTHDEDGKQLSERRPAGLNEYREYVSPIQTFGRATTNELVTPPSVTERTTNLLNEDS